MHLQPTTRVSDVVREMPGSPRIFSEFHVDYCCGGDFTLAEICRRERVDFREFARALEESAADPGATVARTPFDPERATATELIARLLDRHHVDARQSIATIRSLLPIVLAAHRARIPDLERIAGIFDALARELEPHLEHEERDAFPAIVAAERGMHDGQGIAHAVRILRLENELVAELLDLLREVTGGYRPPLEACPTLRALYRELAAFDHELVEHVGLEEKHLLPKAEALAAKA